MSKAVIWSFLIGGLTGIASVVGGALSTKAPSSQAQAEAGPSSGSQNDQASGGGGTNPAAPSSAPGRTWDWKAWRNIRVGMTHKELDALLGPPDQISKQGNQWLYRKQRDVKGGDQYHDFAFDGDRLKTWNVNYVIVDTANETQFSDAANWTAIMNQNETEVSVLAKLGDPRWFASNPNGFSFGYPIADGRHGQVTFVPDGRIKQKLPPK